MKQGLYKNISHEQYQEIDAIRNSYLGRLEKCPALAKVEQKDTEALMFGRAFHVYTLEGKDKFYEEFAVSPKFDKRTKQGKIDSANFEEENQGKEVINEEKHEIIKEMQLAVLMHPTAKKLLEAGISEQTAIWIDEETGFLCKCRPDRQPAQYGSVMLDLKSARSVEEHVFKRDIFSYGYDRECGMYKEGYEAVSGNTIDEYALIAVEKEKPYRTEVFVLEDEVLKHGNMEFHRLLRVERQCRKANYWPNFKESNAIPVSLPNYLKMEELQ